MRNPLLRGLAGVATGFMQPPNHQELDTLLEGPTRSAQLIVAALAAGVIFFGVFVLTMWPEAAGDDLVVPLIFAATAAACAVAWWIVPAAIASRACGQIARGTWRSPGNRATPESEAECLAQVFVTKTIIAAALLEGAAFGNLVAYMLHGHVLNAGITVALLIGILFSFPTLSQVTDWTRDQLNRIEEQRRLESR